MMKRWTKNQEKELIFEYDDWLKRFNDYINIYKHNLILVARKRYDKSDSVLTPKEMACDGFLHNLYTYKIGQEKMKRAVEEAQGIIDELDDMTEIEPL